MNLEADVWAAGAADALAEIAALSGAASRVERSSAPTLSASLTNWRQALHEEHH